MNIQTLINYVMIFYDPFWIIITMLIYEMGMIINLFLIMVIIIVIIDKDLLIILIKCYMDV